MRLTKFAGVLAGASLLLAACGGDDDATTTTEPAVETTVAALDDADPDLDSDDDADGDDANGTGPEAGDTDVPTRIVSLSPTHTEMLFAMGAGDQVIAVDEFSYYPPEAPVTDLSGFAPNVEAIASYEPDLVVTDGTNPDLLGQLDSLGIPRWEGPAAATFDDIYDQIAQLGTATGNDDGAEALIAQMQADIAEIDANLPELDGPLTYYHELDSTYFSVTSDTFIGYVYSQFGLRSIADLAEGSGGQFPQLSAEFILSEDPDLIYLACTTFCGETAESVAARDGWGQLSAVTNGLVIELDDDISSRWGPRIVDFYRQVAEGLAAFSELQPAA